MASVARSEFIFGGQRSGKSRRAETLAGTWLAQSPGHKAVLIATAQPGDEEMRQRIARHQRDRAQRVPNLHTLEEPLALAEAISRCSDAETIIIVDCLTLWLTNLLMPMSAARPKDQHENRLENSEITPFLKEKDATAQYPQAQAATLLIAIEKVAGPLVLVGNEIGMGVIPLGRETRVFVDALGQLNQEVAAACERVTLMAAGLPMMLKGRP